MSNPADEISQAEKRRILVEERRGRTYQGHAMADADLELGGRYAKVNTTIITGMSAGSQYPKMPKGNPWAEDVLAPQPQLDGSGEGDRLGFAIENPSAPVAAHSGADESGRLAANSPGKSPAQSKFKRRI